MKPKHVFYSASLALALLASASAAPQVRFHTLFNGKDLTGWNGNPEFWSVTNGVIQGRTTEAKPTEGNTFLIWTNGEVADFELRLQYKIVGNNPKGQANSGIQYRSKVADAKKWVVGGYQADFEAGATYSGILYEERGRGILAKRGEKVVLKADPDDEKKHKSEITGSVGKSEDIQAKIKKEDWNTYRIVARGNRLQHFINDSQTVDLTDEHAAKAAKSGILALQLHAGPPMTVQFRRLEMKTTE
jgi:hypothetical protein